MAGSADAASVRDFFVAFADYSLVDYAPRYDAMTRAAAADPEIMALVAAAPPEAHSPNNLQAAAHYLLLRGVDHPLAAAYRPDYDGDPGPAFRDLVLTHRDEIADLLATRYVQTNEVNRCAALAPCVNRIAAEHGGPIALVDIGCSAGLNLVFDRYSIVLGDTTLGPPGAPLRLDAASRGATPVTEPATIAWRRGVDRRPVDATDPDEARWLEALVWPDQPERIERLRGAIETLAADPPELVRADALPGLAGALADAPADLLVVVVTSWVAYYFDDELRVAFADAIVDADRPTAWLAMEMPGVVAGVDLPTPPGVDGYESAMTLLAGGAGRPVQRRFLGWTHPHGAWVALAP